MAQSIKLDNSALTNQPSEIQMRRAQPVAISTMGNNKIVITSMTPPTIEITWGGAVTKQAVINELITARGRIDNHVLTWRNEGDTGNRYANIVIPDIVYGQGPGYTEAGVVASFTLICEQYHPMPALDLIDLTASGTLSVGDGKAKWKASSGGRILKAGGFIEARGTGTSFTSIQISNGATDYFSANGTFGPEPIGNEVMLNHVLIASPTFNRGDIIELDIDAIPSGADSANVHVWLLVIRFAV